MTGTTTSTHPRRSWDPDQAADLRRRRRRELCDQVLARAAWLEPSDRALLEAVYRDGRSAVELAQLTGDNPRTLRRRIRRLVRRVLGPEFAFVAGRRERWTSSRRRVAEACILHGQSMRTAASELGVSLHTVRRHLAAIRAQYEVQSDAQPARRSEALPC